MVRPISRGASGKSLDWASSSSPRSIRPSSRRIRSGAHRPVRSIWRCPVADTVNPPMTQEYTNYYLNESNRQLANDNATQKYNQAKLAGESEDRALAAAKFAWQQVMDRANLTGRFEDSWTFPSQK